MKNRNGFVSNSSSSSFIIIGAYYTPKKYDDDFFEKLEDNDVENVCVEDSKGDYIIGKILGYAIEENENTVYDIDDLDTIKTELKLKFAELDINNLNEIKLIVGNALT